MRAVLSGAIWALIAFVAFVACVVNAKRLSLLVDQFHRRRIAVVPVREVRFDDGTLEFAGVRYDTFTLDTLPSGLTASLDAQGRMSFHYQGKSFPCGPGRSIPPLSSTPLSRFPDLVCTPDPGDQVKFIQEQSTFAYPTPFEVNFMTGHSARWRRFHYRTLTWKKPNGASLSIHWRFEQGFYKLEGWSPVNFDDGASGLVDVEIRP